MQVIFNICFYFSNLEGKSIENNYAVLSGLFGLLLTGLIAVCLWTFYPDCYLFILHILFVVTGIIIYYMSYHVSRISFTSENFITETENDGKNAHVPMDTHAKILPLFVKLIDEKKIFLQPNLTLDDIARYIHSNRTYVSHIINEEFQCGFHKFINNKRLDYAKTLAVKNPHFTQEQIAKIKKTKGQCIVHCPFVYWFSMNYSHSIVAGGLELISYTTRFTPFTLLMISLETLAINS